MNLKLPCLLAAVAVITYSNAATITPSCDLVNHSAYMNGPIHSVHGQYVSKEKSTYFDNVVTSSDYNYSDGVPQDVISSPIQRVRLRFSAEDGLRRPLLLAFTPDNAATDGYDYGYDALNYDQYPNDMFWNIDGNNYVIQGVGAFDTSMQYPLNVNITNAGTISIELTDLENFDSEIDVFVYDSLLNIYTQINSYGFEMVLESDIYQNRFFITFASENALSITDNKEASVQVSYLIGTQEIYIKSTELTEVKNVHLINVIGQSIMSWDKQELHNSGGGIRIPVENIPKDTYIIRVETNNSTISKKAIINY